MSPRESAILQGFPASWQLPSNGRAAQKAVGNAVAVQLAHAIILAATAVVEGRAAVALPFASPPPAPEAKEIRRLRRRIEALEQTVAVLHAHSHRALSKAMATSATSGGTRTHR